MKVAMLTTVGDRCGIAAYTRELIGGLRTLPDVEVEVVPISEGKQPTEHYLEQAKILNAPEVDIVHIQHEYSFWGSILPKRHAYWELRYLIKKPIVLTAHTTLSLEEMLHVGTETNPVKRVAKWALLRNRKYRDEVEIAPFATAYTIVHTTVARDLLIARGGKPGYITVLPSGVPAAVPAPTGGRAFRERYGLADRLLITLFGFVTPNKGYELVLDVLPSLPANVRFVIAGGARNAHEEPFLAQLKETIARRGLSESVVITGYLADAEAAEAMEASDVVLVPHTQATNSYSVTLPLTHYRPTLASDLACFREIWNRLECLELFPAGDSAELRTHLLALLEDPARREKLSANARKYCERYSWPKVAASTLRVYKAVIEVYESGVHHPQIVVP